MSNAVDLWPQDIAEGIERTPLAILREQAVLLGEKTKNLLEAEVRSDQSGTLLRHQFYIVAPPLGGYRSILFSVTHAVVELYPVTVRFDYARHEERPVHASSEEALQEALREIFSSQETRRLIKALISQSTAA